MSRKTLTPAEVQRREFEKMCKRVIRDLAPAAKAYEKGTERASYRAHSACRADVLYREHMETRS